MECLSVIMQVVSIELPPGARQVVVLSSQYGWQNNPMATNVNCEDLKGACSSTPFYLFLF